ncbi:hypothetical protein Pmani_020399 [Petrolisthes manimaculis]|uniref:Uncharacterized protein n=1 Tax=Petrolisthes manimaculis TaxID=1843537 RepID=A0AAE1PIQ7_9EUCA|nr:hypothetical protein Pmani_020399 [Petrolisthes manimaculis]
MPPRRLGMWGLGFCAAAGGVAGDGRAGSSPPPPIVRGYLTTWLQDTGRVKGFMGLVSGLIVAHSGHFHSRVNSYLEKLELDQRHEDCL